MKCNLVEKVSPQKLPQGSTADVWLIDVLVEDVSLFAQELVVALSDTSWIQKLDPVGRLSFERTANRTIAALVTSFATVQNQVTSSFGEYMVSMSAGRSLALLLGHEVLPISELWKEKTIHNHGFDFHTESQEYLVAFGEAKYKKGGNPYTQAASQVLEFIALGKDGGDAALLEHLCSHEAIANLLSGHRGFTVAFSVASDNPILVLQNALKSPDIEKLCYSCDQLQIIGVRT
ncbi:hypothetical protein [Geoalkalibacter halelectricus]|uniref:hypothetical protein n=1 Tax=Geoalkalibacter halelectricus TaxID=2847045 RepID=UPI003D19C734